jgi:4-hydroxy-3-methylbut-2-enyl diphosphate reductase
MKIEIAENSGFCFGVKRAIQIAINTAHQNHKVVTLGPIIHNPQMVAYLEERGLSPVDDINRITNETVIIRSHGITSQDYQRLLEKKVNIVDATCPFVKRAQDFAKRLTKEGFQLVILGEKNHPEVEALLSYVEDSAIVVTKPDEKITLQKNKKVGLIAQTTQSEDKFERLAIRLFRKCQELYVVKTICNATLLRQKATRELAKRVDIMIVIGGKNSANTARLAEIAGAEGCNTFHIEIANELKKVWFDNVNMVGVTAGASTPEWIIKEVKEKICKIKKIK